MRRCNSAGAKGRACQGKALGFNVRAGVKPVKVGRMHSPVGGRREDEIRTARITATAPARVVLHTLLGIPYSTYKYVFVAARAEYSALRELGEQVPSLEPCQAAFSSEPGLPPSYVRPWFPRLRLLALPFFEGQNLSRSTLVAPSPLPSLLTTRRTLRTLTPYLWPLTALGAAKKMFSLNKPCCECNRLVKTWVCVQCNNEAFCDTCWGLERPHRPGAVGHDLRPHEKVDEEVVARLKRIFGTSRSEQEQELLHESDINTTWFGVTRGANPAQPVLYSSSRLQDIIARGQTGEFPERFPHLVSFVGQTGEDPASPHLAPCFIMLTLSATGAGKSTVIKMLIDREQTVSQRHDPDESFPGPVTGRVDDMVPTTGDVHLYSDPRTYWGERPTLYADCEGMSGGEKPPLGIACRERLEAAKSTTRMGGKSKLRKPLHWANGHVKYQSREYSVKHLYPRILYTFSDAIVFVLREARMFESEVLPKLVEWAYASIDKSLNQPSLPHLVIVLNATENDIEETQWDLGVATEKLMEAYTDSFRRIPKLQDIVAGLWTIGKRISSTKELLEYYYSSITIVRIPTKGRYMQIDEQIGKLYGVIQEKCALSFRHKKRIRMLLNAERLQQYVNSAYDHFSRHLDEPFDFVKEALRHNPLPQDFRGHLLNVMLSLYHEPGSLRRRQPALDRLLFLSRPIASWVMLASAREGFQGMYQDIQSHLPLSP